MSAPPPRAARRCRRTACSRGCRRWIAAIAATCTFAGVGKSGWPMQNDTMSLPSRSSALTSARTTKAFSVPSDSARRESRGGVAPLRCGALIGRAPSAPLAVELAEVLPGGRRHVAAFGPAAAHGQLVDHARGRPSPSARGRRSSSPARTAPAAARPTTRREPGPLVPGRSPARTPARAACAADRAAGCAPGRRRRTGCTSSRPPAGPARSRGPRTSASGSSRSGPDTPSRTSGRRRSGRPGSGSCTRRSGCSAAPRTARSPAPPCGRCRRR